MFMIKVHTYRSGKLSLISHKKKKKEITPGVNLVLQMLKDLFFFAYYTAVAHAQC